MNQADCLALIPNVRHLEAAYDGSKTDWDEGPVRGQVWAETGNPVDTTIWFSTFQYTHPRTNARYEGDTNDSRTEVATDATEAKRQALLKLAAML